MNTPSIHTVTLPDIGEGVVEGEVIAWLKRVGDPVKQDEPVVVVMTDKATVELPAPEPGIISKHYFKIGEIALRDKPLYDIQTANVSTEVPVKSERTFLAAPCPLSKAPSGPTTSDKVYASPATRKLAKDQGIDITEIKGTGKEGRVLPEDFTSQEGESLKKSPVSKEMNPLISFFEGDKEEPLSGIRQLMAEKMVESCRIIPHFSYFEQADLTRLVDMKEKIGREASSQGMKLTFMPFFIRALSKCCQEFPLLNSSLDWERRVIITHKPHNIGVAMAAPYGLIVPVIKGVENMNLKDLIHAYDDIKKRAFENKLHSREMREGTVTLTNFGALPGASLGGTPIINYPEAAICGVARIQRMPKVVNETIVIRDLMNVSFSFDHRIIDGQLAAKVSGQFCYYLENPACLL